LVTGGLTFTSISVGYRHTCAIASDNYAYCWGFNGFGGLGDNAGTDRYAPFAVYKTGGSVIAGLTIKYISAGYEYTCAVASNNNSYCWGYDNHGQLGDFTTGFYNYPRAVTTGLGGLVGKTVVSVSAGYDHTCAIDNTSLVSCWGDNQYGQLW